MVADTLRLARSALSWVRNSLSDLTSGSPFQNTSIVALMLDLLWHEHGLPCKESVKRAGSRRYAVQVIVTEPEPVADHFRQPFIGHLPGYLAISEAAGAHPPSAEPYNELLLQRWQALLDSTDSADERVLHAFLE